MDTTLRLSENSRQGFDGLKAAFCLGSMEAKSNDASGLRLRLRRKCVRNLCYDYLPFGRILSASDNGRGAAGCHPPAPDTNIASSVDEKFTGQKRDNETGLDYFGVRYMSAPMGRFISPDPLLNSGRPDNPQSWNRYAYAGNNPLRFTDPTGLYKFDETCADNDAVCKENQERFVQGLKDLREAANNLDERSKERKQLEKALKKIGEEEGKGATITFGDAGQTNGLPNFGMANPVTNTITFNMNAINGFTNTNSIIQSGEATAAGFLTGVIGHEGSHLAGNIPALGRIMIRNYFDFAFERSALRTESYVYQGLRMNDPQNRWLWNNEWFALDKHVIEQMRNSGIDNFFKKEDK